MIVDVVAGLLSRMFALAHVAFYTAALSALVFWLLSLQRRAYVRGLQAYLRPLRQRDYCDAGLNPGKRLLDQLTVYEAVELLSSACYTRTNQLPRWTLNARVRITHSLENPEVVADTFGAERIKLSADLLHLVKLLDAQWARTRFVVSAVLGILVAVVVDFALAGVHVPGAASLALTPRALLFAEHPSIFSHVVALLLTGTAAGAAASAVLARRMEPYLNVDQPPIPKRISAEPEKFESSKRIGRKDEVVRAINFSAGGFDAVMQLGVIHALTVIQGRAPDVVVGLSVGAVNAVTLAEVLQAGELAEREQLADRSWSLLTGEEAKNIQNRRLAARVKRLREFIEAAHRAPERLLDALLPDAYQIDASRPLAPLQQPRFAAEERAQRVDFVSARAGLARLYNKLLDVPLAIGTLVKVARRVLGIQASGEIGNSAARWATRLTEGMRLWVLLGSQLIPVATLVPVIYRAYFGSRRDQAPATAAGLIFRSRVAEKVMAWLGYCVSAMLLLLAWYVCSVIALPFAVVTFVVGGLFALTQPRTLALSNLVLDAGQGVLLWIGLTLAITLSIAAFVVLLHAQTFNLASGFAETVEVLKDTYLYMALFAACLLLAIVMTVRMTRSNPRAFVERLLAPYNLGTAIFREHGLRAYLSELFDPDFYAKPPMAQAVNAALGHQDRCGGASFAPPPAPRKVSHYMGDARLDNEQIYVGLAVASTETARLDVVPADTPLIEGLMAATAATPFLPPVELPTKGPSGARRTALYIDGSNVSHEPTHALLRLLRQRRHPSHGPVYIYSVTPFPISKAEQPVRRPDDAGPSGYLNLLEIARRAVRLQRFRDGSLERRLTELISSALPQPINHLMSPDGQPILRAWVTPIELEYDADVNRRVWRAEKEHRRAVVEETIADGCRAAMQVIIPHALDVPLNAPDVGPVKPAAPQAGPVKRRSLKCSLAVTVHLQRRPIGDTLKSLRLPGSELSVGPGLPEICARCSLNRAAKPEAHAQSLQLDEWVKLGPSWPHEREQSKQPVAPDEHFKRATPLHRAELDSLWRQHFADEAKRQTWPRNVVDRNGRTVKGNLRPTVNLLFSGGVFRGVFQMGVLNALNEVGVKPDLIAGASVGSIAAAMIARAFSFDIPHERAAQIARTAGVFLAIDRLILTDRFADFVRNLTIRAAESRFSIRQADRVFRKYDYPSLREFDRNTRRVVAGLERLLYVTPYQLNDLVRAFRGGSTRDLLELVEKRVQQFLDRMQIGEEALGAEALRELITHYVVASSEEADREVFTTDTLRERFQIQFLATTTNLTDGRLEVIGERPASEAQPAAPLEQALLASSAFPGVFRPRWAWELGGLTGATERYIDGGVMDNLPIDAIARFLDRMGRLDLIAANPQTPHLIVAASLEERAPHYALAFHRERFKNSWLALRRRAKQLNYNSKLDTYEFAERMIRFIHAYARAKYPGRGERASPLVDIHLLPIKPNWLCGTFAFHPMLGFKRRSQARSIAHGCASTLRAFAEVKHEQPAWPADWGIDDAKAHIPLKITWSEAFERWEQERKQASADPSRCWLRNCDCPFSRKRLEMLPGLEKPIAEEVSAIHLECLKRETHLRAI